MDVIVLKLLLVTSFLSTGFLVFPANALVGNPIIFLNGHPEPVKFSWSIPKSHKEEVLVIVINNPHGKEVFFLYNKTQVNVSSNYEKRVKDLVCNHGNISFLLEKVTKNDEGNYTCHEGDEEGPVISDCGQTLHYLSSPVVKINSSEEVTGTPGENLTLMCLVESASPDVPSEGYSWTFSPSGSSSVQPLNETGDTLTLGPLTTNSSGQYTCQARNDQNFKGRIPPGSATIPLTVPSKRNSGNHTTSSPSSVSLSIGLGVGLPLGVILIIVALIIMARLRKKCCFQPSGQGRTQTNDPADTPMVQTTPGQETA